MESLSYEEHLDCVTTNIHHCFDQNNEPFDPVHTELKTIK